MPEEQSKKKDAPKTPQELRERISQKKKIDTKEIIEKIATRDLLERDYKEDLLEVIFTASSETRRKIKAMKPTPKQMTEIMILSAEASIFETKGDINSIKKVSSIYEKLSEIAADLTLDKKLDKEFWYERVSTGTLSSFISELMKISQQGPLSEGELESFR